jgi:hypothetical protein
MKRIKVLIFSLTTILAIGSINTQVSWAEPDSTTTSQEIKKINQTIKSLKDKESLISDNIDWIIPTLVVLQLATLSSLVYLIVQNKKLSETVEGRYRSIKSNLDKKLDKPERDSYSTTAEVNRLNLQTNGNVTDLRRKHDELKITVGNLQNQLHNFSARSVTAHQVVPQAAHQVSTPKDRDFGSTIEHLLSPNLFDPHPAPANREPSYLDDYNNRQKNFAEIYKGIVVDREANNYNLSRAGQTEEVILTVESRGNYCLFTCENITYIVPSQKLKIREDKLNEVKDLFDCENYQESNYNNFTLMKPALVTQQSNGNWRLREKGTIIFG